jgi:hypothetical protein
MIAWIGTVASIIGSFAVALAYFQAGYLLFTAGSMCWLWVAYSRRDHSLALLNSTFLIANLVGIYKNFF